MSRGLRQRSTTPKAPRSAIGGSPNGARSRCSRSVTACLTPDFDSTRAWRRAAPIASFTVVNTGDRGGVDVPQLYLTAAPGERRLRLLGFERVELEPGRLSGW